MKKILFIVVLSIFLCCKNSLADLNNGLVAYYPFNGNANDESSFANHGTVFGATLINDRFGNPESAYFFDGVNDYIEILDSEHIDFHAQDFSTCFWVKKLKNSTDWNNCPGVSKWNSSLSHATNEWNIVLCQKGNTDIPGFSVENDTTIYSIPSSEKIDLNNWFFIVGIREKTQISIYVNGELKNSTYIGDISVNNAGRNLIIAHYSNVYSNAIFDDLRIFNRALSEVEVKQLYNAPNPNCVIIDTDADGVPDNWDDCPNTPQESWVNSNGCRGDLRYSEEDMLGMVNKLLQWDTNKDKQIGLIEVLQILKDTAAVRTNLSQ